MKKQQKLLPAVLQGLLVVLGLGGVDQQVKLHFLEMEMFSLEAGSKIYQEQCKYPSHRSALHFNAPC